MSDRDDAVPAGSGRGLIVDYGGVLTTSVARSFRNFEQVEGLPKGVVFDVVAEAYAGREGAIARFERGELTAAEFGRLLAEELAERGHRVRAERLHERIFGSVSRAPDVWSLVQRVRAHGVRTALLSNSWGRDGYPEAELDAHFDVIVISGEVGLRKPDPEIFRLTADRLGVPPERCAFVDDLQRNVEAARQVGMCGVHHRGDIADTVRALEDFFGLELVDA